MHLAPSIALIAVTIAQQSPPPAAQEPQLFPIDLSFSCTALEPDQSPSQGTLHVELRQFYAAWANSYELWGTPDATGAMNLDFAGVHLDPSAPVDITIAPVSEAKERYLPSIPYTSAYLGRNFEGHYDIQSAPGGGGHSISLGAITFAEAPIVGTITVGSTGGPATKLYIKAGEYDGGLMQSIGATTVTAVAGQPMEVYSWHPARIWTVYGSSSDGAVVAPSSFLRARAVDLQPEHPVSFSITYDPQQHGTLHRIALFPAPAYQPLDLDPNLPEAIIEAGSHHHLEGAAYKSSPNGSTVIGFSDVLPREYVVEGWTLSDYPQGLPTTTLTFTAAEGVTVQL